jgi:hypothetical protein
VAVDDRDYVDDRDHADTRREPVAVGAGTQPEPDDHPRRRSFFRR